MLRGVGVEGLGAYYDGVGVVILFKLTQLLLRPPDTTTLGLRGNIHHDFDFCRLQNTSSSWFGIWFKSQQIAPKSVRSEQGRTGDRLWRTPCKKFGFLQWILVDKANETKSPSCIRKFTSSINKTRDQLATTRKEVLTDELWQLWKPIFVRDERKLFMLPTQF